MATLFEKSLNLEQAIIFGQPLASARRPRLDMSSLQTYYDIYINEQGDVLSACDLLLKVTHHQ